MKRKGSCLERRGGWGYVLGDEGSGYAIGREMLRLFVKQADHRAIPSHLFQEVMHLYDLKDPSELIGKIMEDGKVNRTLVAQCASLCDKDGVLEEVRMILEEQAKQVAEMINSFSEHMLACTLAVYKNLFAYEKVAQKHEWTNLGSVPTISQLKVLSIGMGNIGSAYAKLMHTLGARVYGLTRTKHELPDYLEDIYTFDKIDDVLADKDVIALSLPETEQTKHLFNYERLHQIKQGAMIINVGRGSAIVAKDLVRIMKEKHLRAACLDVTEYEPLPKNMDLWNVENVYITPHISGRFNAQANYDNVIHIFHKNLLHFINKEPLENIVDKTQGY